MLLNPFRFGGGGPPPSGFATFISSNFSDFAGANTSHPVAMPATVNAGDLLFICCMFDNAVTITTPSGWTAVSDQDNAGAAVRGAVFSKTAAGTEGGTTVTVSLSGNASGLAHVRRYQAGTFGAGIEAAQTGYNGLATSTPSALTPSWGAADTAWFVFGTSWQIKTISSYPLPDNQTDDSTILHTCWSSSKEENTATQTPGNQVLTTSSWGTLHTVGIQPA